ncbi:MAG: Gx transporter family protein [Tepidanaerobacteraceae bacterium]|jgi:heptaprenyl diphosphate synthase
MKSRKMIYLSLLVTCGIVLHIIENMFPVPFPIPGAKLGLANIISLLAIVIYGLKEGLIISALRCIIGAFLIGSLSSLIYSLSGAVLSTIVMALAYEYFNKIFSLVGISILGGVTHNFTQITIASLALSTSGLFFYLPYLMVIGLFTGLFTGLVANFVKQYLLTTLMKNNFMGEGNAKNEA